MRIPCGGLAALSLLLASCTIPCRPVPHGREPLGGIWYFKAGDNPAWALPGLDETVLENGWRVVDVPGGLKDYTKRSDTAGWLRVRFDVPGATIGRDNVLLLGRADARLEPWLNGRPLEPLADAGGDGPPVRAFTVPRTLLQDTSVLAIRSKDWEAAGGITAGPVDLVPRADWERRAARPSAAVREVAGAHARIVYDPNAHRLTAFAAGDTTVLDDAHFVLRTKVREYDLGRIPETEVETLPDGRGIRTLHVLAGEKIRFEARYVLPASVDWPVLAVVGEATSEDGRAVDLDLVYHAATPGVIGTGALRTTPAGRFAWGRLFVYAPKGDLEILPESVRKYYRPEGAFELMADSRAGQAALPYPIELPTPQRLIYDKLTSKTLTFDFKEAKLSEMLDYVLTSLDLKVQWSTDIRDEVYAKRITFKVNSHSAYSALKMLLSQYGLGFEIDNRGIIHIAECGQGIPPNPRFLALNKLEQARHGSLRDDRESEEIEKLVRSSFDQIHVTLEVENQPVREVVEFLRQFTNLSMVFDAEVDQAKTVTYRCQNTPLSRVMKDLLGTDYDYVFNPKLQICSVGAAESIRERKRAEKTRRDQVLSHVVIVRGINLTATLDRLRRLDSLPLVPDREVWEKGKNVTLDADGVPLRDFLDRAAAKLGATWAYCEGTIYIYMPAEK